MLQQFKKFPFGYYVCCLSFTFERLSYYAAKWGIAIFIALAAASGGLGLTKAQGAFFSSQFVAWASITPVIGGYIADRWISPRILVPIGDVLMAAGYLAIARATDTKGIWMCVILVAVGTAFFKGNVSGINGRQFPNDKDTLTSAFSLQYSFVNIGSFCGTTFLPLLATGGNINGYRIMFLVCAGFMLFDAIWWIFGMKYLGDAGKKPFIFDNRNENTESSDLKENKSIKENLKENLKENTKPLTKAEKKRVAAIIILTLLSGVFWVFWYLTYMPVYYEFGPVSQGGCGWADWSIGSWEIPTAWYDSVNGLLCIVLCPVFAALWIKLSKTKRGDPSMLTKTALGIMLLGLAIAAMALGAAMYKSTGKPVGLWIIILTAICMTVGEALFSPLGNSFISEYAPKKLLGTLLGVWPLVIFFAGLIYGPLYNRMSKHFIPAFTGAAIIIFIIGAILLIFTKKFEAMLKDDSE